MRRKHLTALYRTLAALLLGLVALAVFAQTPAEVARKRKLEKQGKAPAAGTAAPAGVVPGAAGGSGTASGSGTAGAPAGKPPAAPVTPGAAKPVPAPAAAAPTPGSPGSRGSAGSAPASGSKPGAEADKADKGGVLPGSTPTPSLGDIDQILEGEEQVLSGGGYSYDPGNRRDPFKSLLAAADRQEFRGPRPDGVPGLLIDEIDLTGIFKTARGYVAQVKAPNQAKSYLLKEGDQLFDGDVVSISHKEVVFKQTVQDPTALKPFREVVKTLSP